MKLAWPITYCTFRFLFLTTFDRSVRSTFFFFNDTATTEIYTLSLHDALPICYLIWVSLKFLKTFFFKKNYNFRSEEHTSELQSRPHLVCRLLLEKKINTTPSHTASEINMRAPARLPPTDIRHFRIISRIFDAP